MFFCRVSVVSGVVMLVDNWQAGTAAAAVVRVELRCVQSTTVTVWSWWQQRRRRRRLWQRGGTYSAQQASQSCPLRWRLVSCWTFSLTFSPPSSHLIRRFCKPFCIGYDLLSIDELSGWPRCDLALTSFNFVVCRTKAVWYLLHKPGSRHCHLAIGHCTMRQRVFDCKYLSLKFVVTY